MKITDRIKNLFRRENVRTGTEIKMIADRGNGYYSFDGRLYRSDMVRAAIRPYSKAIGKLVAKHIRKSEEKLQVNPEPYIRFLLEEPNPFMSGQVLQEKIATQLAINNNAFMVILRDEFGVPRELYPVPAASAQTVYNEHGELFIKFYLTNSKVFTFPYSQLIHLRNDFYGQEVFGDSPAEALVSLMEVATIADQSVVQAVKNSGVVRWLLKFASKLRPEDVRTAVSEFADTYLNVESDTFGAAGVSGDCDIQRVEPKDFVPNAAQQKNVLARIYAFFNTNEKIVHSSFTEDEWNSYFEAVIEPTALQMEHEYTRRLFTRRERAAGNTINFEASNLNCASLSTKLSLLQMVDRGALTPNEWRATFNLTPVDGGDVPIRRLDTAPTVEGGEGD